MKKISFRKTGKAGKVRLASWVLLLAFTGYVLLDTFVIPRTYAAAGSSTASSSAKVETVSTGTVSKTGTTYSDDNITVKITTYRKYDTNIYVADVTVKSAAYLQTAFADDTFGKNITDKTSTIASDHNAILAINGDFCGAQNSGYVIRNGKLYRSASAGDDQEDLVIDGDGNFSIVSEGDATAESLLKSGAQQVLSFGPGLVENGKVTVSESEEVGKAMASNPRTAIGQIDSLHYVLVVSDGRTDESTGLSLYQMAAFLKTLGVETAYNLDGGGSSTMYFNGSVVNNPTTTGRNISERSVSDIVYIGY